MNDYPVDPQLPEPSEPDHDDPRFTPGTPENDEMLATLAKAKDSGKQD
jgi:hypothetical protein